MQQQIEARLAVAAEHRPGPSTQSEHQQHQQQQQHYYYQLLRGTRDSITSGIPCLLKILKAKRHCSTPRKIPIRSPDMMIDLVSTFKSVLNASQSYAKFDTTKLHIDNVIFRLHYQFTVGLLVAFSVIINSRQYFGDPILCTGKSGDPSARVVDSYCWIYAFVPDPRYSMKQYEEIPEDQRNYVKYYPWVGIFLLFQSVIFYMPHYLWKNWECNRVRNFLEHTGDFRISDSNVQSQFIRTLHSHRGYTVRHFVCEGLNLLNVLAQMLLTDWFFGYEFSTFGLEVVSMSESTPEKRNDSLNKIFPKVAACVFPIGGHFYGSRELRYPICVLPVNIFIEKACIFLWFYFMFIALVSTLALIHRVAFILSTWYRSYVLHICCDFPKNTPLSAIDIDFDYGDCFFLIQLARNANSFVFTDFIHAMCTNNQGTCGIDNNGGNVKRRRLSSTYSHSQSEKVMPPGPPRAPACSSIFTEERSLTYLPKEEEQSFVGKLLNIFTTEISQT